ncbi:Bifunctional adenosylcobalamin biosynthesis protein CobP [BD1-7 clade bacterium]|uniref:Bifunctional adenosylcobalamin biosynthesis protein n=1 Tax=BD1-7 clade bacterium TaxID=2029982 RepID=A0A5S9Q9M3_9GAMM|nr:Bifunctional adenosylcobalamin biosynthesis protein CobP [BD1-7 clade bacterium]CAA0115648.1 Bifunctional adenosylcobalamin biosynthesis protein CobP [BD1-7 clade bacterium]
MIELVLGGARSGKSRYAEQTALAAEKPLFYVATATVYDDEMRQRVTRHQSDRTSHHQSWTTVEEPLCLADALTPLLARDVCVVVDCLTLWVTNCLLHEDSNRWQAEKLALYSLLENTSTARLIMVTNEVGQGIVPLGELNRRFVDESGWLHQELAQLADKVTLVTAGLPLTLKEESS